MRTLRAVRTWIVLLLVLVATACSNSVVVADGGQGADSVPFAAATEAPALSAPPTEPEPSAPTSDPNATPEVFTDELGDWYVPVAGTTPEPDRPSVVGLSADEILNQINAAIPAEYALSFEWQSMALTDEHTAQALAPIEWTKDDRDYEYEDTTLGFFTEYEVDSGCQGFCAPQDWERLMNNPADSPFRLRADQSIEILLDQTLTDPPGRLLVADRAAVETGGVSISVEVVRWSDDADRFLECNGRLSEEDRSLWPTFADVCLAATGDWLG